MLGWHYNLLLLRLHGFPGTTFRISHVAGIDNHSASRGGDSRPQMIGRALEIAHAKTRGKIAPNRVRRCWEGKAKASVFAHNREPFMV